MLSTSSRKGCISSLRPVSRPRRLGCNVHVRVGIIVASVLISMVTHLRALNDHQHPGEGDSPGFVARPSIFATLSPLLKTGGKFRPPSRPTNTPPNIRPAGAPPGPRSSKSYSTMSAGNPATDITAEPEMERGREAGENERRSPKGRFDPIPDSEKFNMEELGVEWEVEDVGEGMKSEGGTGAAAYVDTQEARKRRDFLIASAAAGASVPIIMLSPKVFKTSFENLRQEGQADSNIGRGIRALAKAERQAVETVAEVQIDPNDGNEYWILRNPKNFAQSWISKLTNKETNFRVLKRRVSDTEVVAAGLAAGAVVEAARIFLLHPIDTIKTRLQAVQRPKPPTEEELEMKRQRKISTLAKRINIVDEQLSPRARYVPRKTMRGVKVLQKIALQERLNETMESEFVNPPTTIPKEVFASPWDGLSVALLSSAPQGAVYWAVRDVVKRNLIQAAPAAVGGVKSVVPGGITGALVTKTAALIAAFSSLVGPTAAALALDYRSAATLFAVTCGEAMYWLVRTPGEILKTRRQIAVLEEKGIRQRSRNPLAVLPGIIEVFRIYPLLALVDLPQVAGRVWVFLILHNNPHTPTTSETDLFFYIIAAILAAAFSTPLDVARTRLLLQRERDVQIEVDRATRWEEAIEAGKAAAEATAAAIEMEQRQKLEENLKEEASQAAEAAASKVAEAAAYAESLGVEVMEIVPTAKETKGILAEFAENIMMGEAEKKEREEEARRVERKMVEFVRKNSPKPSQNPRYDGIIDCLQQIWRKEGLPGLFAGVGYRMLWNGLVVGFILAIQRTSYEGVRTAIMFRVLDQINEIMPSVPTDPAVSEKHSALLTAFGLAAGALNHLADLATHGSTDLAP